MRSDPGLNPSLDAAGAELAGRGATGLLVVLGDVAGAEAADLAHTTSLALLKKKRVSVASQLLTLLVEGLNNPQIGERLSISVTTVRSHVSNILSKLEVSNRAEAIALALAGVLWFGERLRWELMIAIPMALAGLGLIVGLDASRLDADYRWGIGFGLLTALAYAAYLLSLRQARIRGAQTSPVGDLAVASLFSAAALALSAGVEGISLALPTVRDAGLVTAYALVAQVLGWVLISSSLREVPASTVGLLLLLAATSSVRALPPEESIWVEILDSSGDSRGVLYYRLAPHAHLQINDILQKLDLEGAGF